MLLQTNYLASKNFFFQLLISPMIFDSSGVVAQALTSMAALGKITSTARNKSSADVLDKHPDSFSQPAAEAYEPRLVKRDGDSYLKKNRAYYNPPRKTKPRPSSASKQQSKPVPDENQKKEDQQLALRFVRRSKVLSFHLLYSYAVFNVSGKYSRKSDEFF